MYIDHIHFISQEADQLHEIKKYMSLWGDALPKILCKCVEIRHVL